MAENELNIDSVISRLLQGLHNYWEFYICHMEKNTHNLNHNWLCLINSYVIATLMRYFLFVKLIPIGPLMNSATNSEPR